MSLSRADALVLVVLAAAVAASAGVAAGAHGQHHDATGDRRLGTVHFATSCTPAAQRQFDHAVALLHSFEFGAAIEAFDETLRTDPTCTIAHWGVALCLWGNPFAARERPAAQLQSGLDAIERARRAPPRTERERDYVAAAECLYAHFGTTSQSARAVGYERAMEGVAGKYPDDREASIFYALSLAASASPSDTTYANQLKAGAILERLFPEQPDHPGIAHYIIHSYDVPPLAGRALEAARRYSAIAPGAPHALHMPSHTFTRLGYWQESIDANLAAAASAKRERDTAEELHAMDYLAYAYLQTAQDAEARRLLDALPEVSSRFDPDAAKGAAPPLAGLYSMAAIPARYALERRAWKEAAALAPRVSTAPQTDAMTCFARALGAAHTGDLAVARSSIAALDEIRQRLAQARELYWAEQVAIEHQAAQAWLALAEGRPAEALQAMREAAGQEDRTEKNAVTPGPLAPARELLGDMLLQMDRPADALREYTATLAKEPNRFRAVYGAARAARLAGDAAAARGYYRQLLKICAHAGSPGRPELQEAREHGGPAHETTYAGGRVVARARRIAFRSASSE
jgi:hypothetical protein